MRTTFISANIDSLRTVTISITFSFRSDPLKDPKICGRPQCDLETSKFEYNSKTKYKYNYWSHVRSEFHGTGQNTSDMFVTASVALTFPTKCEGSLMISETELRNKALTDDEADESTDDVYNSMHPKSSDFATEIQKYPMKFVSNPPLESNES